MAMENSHKPSEAKEIWGFLDVVLQENAWN